MKTSKTSFSVIVVSALLMAASGLITFLLSNAIVDDAFIFLKFADNILAHGEFTFNKGEPVNAISSPLYLLLLIVVRATGLSGESSLLILWGSGLFVALISLFILTAGRDWLLRAVLLVALLGQVSLLRSVGMETTWFIACLILLAVTFESNSKIYSCLFTGLLVLVRLEGFLIILPLIIIGILSKKIPWREIITALLVLGVYLLFCAVYFDNLIPNSIAIKSIQSSFGIWKETSFFSYILSEIQFPVITILLSAMAIPFLFQEAKSNKYGVIFIALFCLTHSIAFIISGAPSHYHWYRVPAYFLLSICSSYSLIFLSSLVIKNNQNSLTSKIFLFLVISLVLLTVGSEEFKIPHKQYKYSASYKKLSEWIRTNTDKNSKIATAEVGYIGYYSKRYIVDKAGLINPDSVEKIQSSKSLDWWITPDNLPDYLVERTKFI